MRYEARNQDAENDLNRDSEVSVQVAESIVKRQSRNAAEEERNRVDDVGDEIQQLCQQHRVVVENGFNVRKVTTRTQSYQMNAKSNECDEASLLSNG